MFTNDISWSNKIEFVLKKQNLKINILFYGALTLSGHRYKKKDSSEDV